MSLRRSLLTCVSIACLFLSQPAAQAQDSATSDETPPKQAQRVSGRVVSALDQHPLPHAIVSLQETKARQNVLSTTSDNEGNYRFDAVPPGKYTLLGEARGYQSATYLHHEQFGTAIVTGAGLETDGLILQLTPLARISGRILDEAGDPVERATVGLYREAAGTATERITRFRAVQTNDTGEYEFDRLPPGRYFIAASGTPWYAVHPQPDQKNATYPYAVSVDPKLDVTYPTVYYPHALDSAEASPFDLKGGEQIVADLQMQAVPSISLHFTLPAGDPQTQVFPQLMQDVFGIEEFVPSQGMGVNDGQGTITGLAPGQYHVRLQRPGISRLAASAAVIDLTSTSNTLDLSQPADLASLRLTVHPGSEQTLPSGLQVILRSTNNNQPAGNAPLDDKASATLASVASGDYRLQLNGGGRPVNVVSLSVNGKPQPDRVLHVNGSGSLSVDLTVSTFAATIDGFVLGRGQDGRRPDAGSMLVLVPAGADTSASLFRRDQSDLDGSFTFANVVPGKYLIVAIDDGWPLRWSDPAALAPYLLHATPIAVSATGPKKITLAAPVTPQPR
jgi:hypothetical protein